ncbi:PREDICTED: cholecystokinin receptor type A-like, partial [Rhagoletis zephyria]|uniref:cholecystokinin receptor type A-like n=1 Tax=Rhagoletis zephyria TaxID=28612 RepID=UPI000811420A
MDHSKNSTAELETLGFASQVFFVSLYSLTALCAFASNLVTIVVLIKGRRCTRDLRKFLINLSVADLLMSFTTIPFTYTNYMFGRWIFWPIMCPIVNMAQLTTITVSVFTLVAIAIDRYFAIMHPLQRSISWFKAHRALIVLVIWVFGITIGLTQVWVSKTGSFVFKTGVTYNTCGERWLPESMEGQIYTGFIFTVTFALPMAILSVVYSAMGCRLLRYRMPGQLLSQSTCYGGSGNSLRSPEQSDLFAEGGGGGGGGGGHTANAHHHSATTKNSSLRKSVSSKLCTKSDKSRLLLVVPNSGEGAELNQQQHNNEQQPKSQTKKRPERQSTENIAAAHPLTNTYDNDVKENYSGKTIDGEKCHMGDAQTPPKEASSPPKINEPMGRNGSRGKEKQFAKSTTAVSNGHCLGKAKCTTASVNYRFVAQTGGNTASAAEVLLPSSSGNFATVKRKASSGGSSNSSSIKAAHQHNQHHQHSHHPHHQQNHQHNHYSHKIINIRRNK